MATTRIMPLHTGKGRTERQAVSDIIDYAANPQKTDNGRLVTGFACDSRVADAEFLLAKREYISTTGRVRGVDDVLAYHVRQSFVPGEITPEEANRLGVEFASRFTKGNHAFVVCTHIDKLHIHNYIIWNAVNLLVDIQAKLQGGKGAGYARWAKVFNLKQMAQTMNYLTEHGLLEYAVLEEKAATATAAAMSCRRRSRRRKPAWRRLPYCGPISSITPRPARSMRPTARRDILRNF